MFVNIRLLNCVPSSEIAVPEFYVNMTFVKSMLTYNSLRAQKSNSMVNKKMNCEINYLTNRFFNGSWKSPVYGYLKIWGEET